MLHFFLSSHPSVCWSASNYPNDKTFASYLVWEMCGNVTLLLGSDIIMTISILITVKQVQKHLHLQQFWKIGWHWLHLSLNVEFMIIRKRKLCTPIVLLPLHKAPSQWLEISQGLRPQNPVLAATLYCKLSFSYSGVVPISNTSSSLRIIMD